MSRRFTATITKDEVKGGWTYVIWPDSVAYLGTGKATKVEGTLDGHEFQATLLPWGDGTHMLPIKAPLMKALNKKPGDTVEVSLKKRTEPVAKPQD
jgi:hypothetical protein